MSHGRHLRYSRLFFSSREGIFNELFDAVVQESIIIYKVLLSLSIGATNDEVVVVDEWSAFCRQPTPRSSLLLSLHNTTHIHRRGRHSTDCTEIVDGPIHHLISRYITVYISA